MVVAMIKCHIENKLLGFSLQNWLVGHVSRFKRMAQPIMQSAYESSDDHQLPFWSVAVRKWLELLLSLCSWEVWVSCWKKVVQGRLYPSSSGYNISQTTKLLMMWLQRAKGSPVSDITVAPPVWLHYWIGRPFWSCCCSCGRQNGGHWHKVLNTLWVHPRLANQMVPWEDLEAQIRATECVRVG